MATLGTVTRYAIIAGLVGFLVFALIPGRASLAVQITIFTPIVASCIAGVELILHKKPWHGLAMIAAVALAIGSMLVGVAP